VGAREPDASVTIWRPQPGPQTSLLTCPVFEVFYGGARGGGKTDGMLGEWLAHAGRFGDKASGIVVRREREQLIDTIERAKQIFIPLGAKFTDHPPRFRFPDGARLIFQYLERDADAENYQGHSYTRVYVEEIGNFPDPKPVLKMMATLRSAHGVPCRFRATGNPGGPGHQWVRARYIDPAPKGFKVIPTEFVNPFTNERVSRERVYIPARLKDNKYLGSDYVANLQMSGAPELVRAWLEGDWTVIAGSFFPEFSLLRHVVAPIPLPAHWTRFRACDWGSAKPFSVGWYAISDGELPQFPRGALVKYREWYGVRIKPDGSYEPNVGVKMTAEEVAAGILEREQGEEINITHSVIDPAAYAENGGPSIAERMYRAGVKFRPADNKRVAMKGALSGWDQLRARLKGNGERAMLYFFATCVHTIRTLPALQHDAAKPEDVDTEGEDHAPDETRYACMSRPFVRVDEPAGTPPRFFESLSLDELWQDQPREVRI